MEEEKKLDQSTEPNTAPSLSQTNIESSDTSGVTSKVIDPEHESPKSCSMESSNLSSSECTCSSENLKCEKHAEVSDSSGAVKPPDQSINSCEVNDYSTCTPSEHPSSGPSNIPLDHTTSKEESSSPPKVSFEIGNELSSPPDPNIPSESDAQSSSPISLSPSPSIPQSPKSVASSQSGQSEQSNDSTSSAGRRARLVSNYSIKKQSKSKILATELELLVSEKEKDEAIKQEYKSQEESLKEKRELIFKKMHQEERKAILERKASTRAGTSLLVDMNVSKKDARKDDLSRKKEEDERNKQILLQRAKDAKFLRKSIYESGEISGARRGSGSVSPKSTSSTGEMIDDSSAVSSPKSDVNDS